VRRGILKYFGHARSGKGEVIEEVYLRILACGGLRGICRKGKDRPDRGVEPGTS